MRLLTNTFYLLLLNIGFFSCFSYAENKVNTLVQGLDLLNCTKIQNSNIFIENFYSYDYKENKKEKKISSYILNKSHLAISRSKITLAKKHDLLDYQFISNKKDQNLNKHWLFLYNSQLPTNKTIKKKSLFFKTELKELGLNYLFLVQQNPKNLNCFVKLVDSFYVTYNPEQKNTANKRFNKAFTCYQTHQDKEKNKNCKNLPSLKKLYHLKQIQAPKAWQLSTGKGVSVALIDSGVNYLHPYLQNQFVAFKNNKGSYDFEFNDAFAFDEFGHGTAMAGFISSSFGVAPEAKLISFKINATNTRAIINAFKESIKNKVQVINFSLSYSRELLTVSKKELVELKQVFNKLLENDILVLQAAGNTGQDLDLKVNRGFFLQFNYPNWLRVAAYDENFNKSIYSNYSKKFVDIVAPGGSDAQPLFSTFINNEQGILFNYSQGTSQATAIASGVAALIRSHKPYLSAIQVKYILLNSGPKHLPEVSRSGRIINAWEALNF